MPRATRHVPRIKPAPQSTITNLSFVASQLCRSPGDELKESPRGHHSTKAGSDFQVNGGAGVSSGFSSSGHCTLAQEPGPPISPTVQCGDAIMNSLDKVEDGHLARKKLLQSPPRFLRIAKRGQARQVINNVVMSPHRGERGKERPS